MTLAERTAVSGRSPLSSLRARLDRLSASSAAKPLRELGGCFAMGLDVLTHLPRRPFAWREFLLQAWFVARVSMFPTVMLAIPFTVLMVFTSNILLVEFGAADYSGTDHDARRRHDAVVRAEHPGAKPVQTLADVLEVSFTGMLRVR